MTVSCIARRELLLGGISLAALLTIHGTARAQGAQFTEWGWRRPYEKISDKSVVWLKEKGWWPLQIAFQAPWSGQNNINIVMDKAGLLAQRGIEAKLKPSAPGRRSTKCWCRPNSRSPAAATFLSPRSSTRRYR
ncbi:MAG TPA: hypothetical protein VKG24_20050 [Pseudolabrys sp.]|nr:hypothetical protein [Pseudolabrys sp.]